MIEVDSAFRKPLELALHGALQYLESLDSAPVAASANAQTLRSRMNKPLQSSGIRADCVVEELLADVSDGITGSGGGRFFAWVMGGSLPAALAAEWLTAAWDQNAAQFTSAPAAAVAEEVAGEWLKQLLGLPATASFAFVTGCQMAHATCLAAARHALLARIGYDAEERGLYGAPEIRIITSTAHHGSLTRAMRLLGMGSSHIIALSAGVGGRLDADTLHEALHAAQDSPVIVVLQAGDINTGVFDDFATLVPLAHEHGAWAHVDGAFGLWAAASPSYRHLTNGASDADSWATDGHKLLNVPYDNGYAFVRDSASHCAAMFAPAPYIPIADDGRNAMMWNPEWSRRARGFATYAALRELGRDGIADLVDRCCTYAHAITTRIAALDGAQLLWEPVFNQGLVRFIDPYGTSEEQNDRYTDAAIEEITQSGEAFFGGTTWRGRRAMRVSVCNWQTTQHDVERTVQAVAQVLKRRRTASR